LSETNNKRLLYKRWVRLIDSWRSKVGAVMLMMPESYIAETVRIVHYVYTTHGALPDRVVPSYDHVFRIDYKLKDPHTLSFFISDDKVKAYVFAYETIKQPGKQVESRNLLTMIDRIHKKWGFV